MPGARTRRRAVPGPAPLSPPPGAAELEATRRISRGIEGWLTDREGELLYSLAKRCGGRGVIVEVGSWKGKSTVWLARGSMAGREVPVYAIDPHTGSLEHREALGEVWTFEEFRRNVTEAGVGDLVIPLLATSEQAARQFEQPIELLFIDGAHEYDLVRLDFELWFPKLIEGGVMAFHDTIGWPGPRKVVSESVYRSQWFRSARFVNSITLAEKVGRNTVSDRIRNRRVLAVKTLYECACRLHPPRPLRGIGRAILDRLQ